MLNGIVPYQLSVNVSSISSSRERVATAFPCSAMYERAPQPNDASETLSGGNDLSIQSSNSGTPELSVGDCPIFDRELEKPKETNRELGSPVSSTLEPPSNSVLLRYFRDVARYPTIDIDTEQRYAQALASAEVAHWVALLSYLPVAGVILEYLGQRLIELDKNERPDKPRAHELEQLCNHYREQEKLDAAQQTKWRHLTTELGRAIRLADADREWVNRACDVARAYVASRGVKCNGVHPSTEEKRYIRRVGRTELRVRNARNAIVTAYLRLVLSIAFRYDRGRVPLADSIQEGNLGLLKAVNRFDHTRGYRFSTYASWWIRYFISSAVDEKGRMIRIPVHALRTHRRIAKARGVLYALSGHAPALDELEQASGVPRHQIAAAHAFVTEVSLSLDRPLGDGGSAHLVDMLIDEERPSAVELLARATWAKEVDHVLVTLTPMESNIIRLRFGLDDGAELTLQDIGNRYHLSRERIRQLEKRAMDKIRGEVKGYWRVDNER